MPANAHMTGHSQQLYLCAHRMTVSGEWAYSCVQPRSKTMKTEVLLGLLQQQPERYKESRRTSQVDWREGGMPVVGDEHAVLTVQAAIQLHLQRHLQRCQREQRIPELRDQHHCQNGTTCCCLQVTSP